MDNEILIKHQFPTTKEFIKFFNSVGWEREEKRVDENRKTPALLLVFIKIMKFLLWVEL